MALIQHNRRVHEIRSQTQGGRPCGGTSQGETPPNDNPANTLTVSSLQAEKAVSTAQAAGSEVLVRLPEPTWATPAYNTEA